MSICIIKMNWPLKWEDQSFSDLSLFLVSDTFKDCDKLLFDVERICFLDINSLRSWTCCTRLTVTLHVCLSNVSYRSNLADLNYTSTTQSLCLKSRICKRLMAMTAIMVMTLQRGSANSFSSITIMDFLWATACVPLWYIRGHCACVYSQCVYLLL